MEAVYDQAHNHIQEGEEMKDLTLGEIWTGFYLFYREMSVVFTTAMIVGWIMLMIFG